MVFATALLASTILAAGRPAAASSLTTAEIVKRVSPAVVAISSLASGGESTGSGVVIDPSGLIVTNVHVIAGARAVKVRLPNGDIFDQVKVRAFDDRKDLAIIQVAGFKLPSVILGDSDETVVGQNVVLIGNPHRLDNSVSAGVVSGIRVLDGFRVIQTDAAANAGNSGGPLLNSGGEAIGILSFKVRGSENLNFVIPSNYVRGMLGSLEEPLSLDEFSLRLAKVVDSKPDGLGLTTKWKSLVNGATKVVRADGDYVYVETVLPDRLAQAGVFVMSELKKDGTQFLGVQRSLGECDAWEKTGFAGRVQRRKWCTLETPIAITSYGATRIEGTIESYTLDDVDCERCAVTRSTTRSFTWIRE